MAGVKGRSGRRPRSTEEKRLNIIDKAWEVVLQYLSSDDPLSKRVDVAIKVATKDMPADTIIDQSKHSHYLLKWKENGSSTGNNNRVHATPSSD